MSEKKIEQERAEFDKDLLLYGVGFLVDGKRIDPRRVTWHRADASISVDVPDFGPWPTKTADEVMRDFSDMVDAMRRPAAQPAAELTNVRCQCCTTEYPHNSYEAGFIAGSGMCQMCDAAMPPKDLPAAEQSAPGEMEEVEVVGYRFFHVDHGYIFRRTHIYEGNPSLEAHGLMTVAQHKRIAAQLAARDSGVVRVPESFARFLIGETEIDGVAFGERHPKLTGMFWWRDQLRALLAQRERGGGEA